MRKTFFSFLINLGLLFSGLISMISGLLIQMQYHVGNHGVVVNKYSLGLNYSSWSNIHKIAIIILSILIFFHIEQHWKWYKIVFAKKLLSKNRQVITLSIIFVLVAITGFISWTIDLLEGSELIHRTLIEIHDKIAIILSIYLVLHIAKRLKWFKRTFEKMNKQFHKTYL